MSNALAIAAASKCLQKLLEVGIKVLTTETGHALAPNLGFEAPDPRFKLAFAVELKPPHALEAADGDKISLYLYDVELNPHLRNQEFPKRGPKAGTSAVPLPLNLFYLVTPMAKDQDGVKEQQALGAVMNILHDHPVLTRKDLAALDTLAAGIDQIDQVKFTFHPIGQEEMTRLWSGMQAKYRLSVAYAASVVLVESLRPVRSVLPVVERGLEPPDGFEVRPASVFTGLKSASFHYLPAQLGDRALHKLAFGRFGDTLVLEGQGLAYNKMKIVFQHPKLKKPIEEDVQLPDRDDRQVRFRIPAATFNAEDKFFVGTYTVSVDEGPADAADGAKPRPNPTNAVSFTLVSDLEIQTKKNTTDTIRVLEILPRPKLRKGQVVSILFNDHEVRVGEFDDKMIAFWIYLKGKGLLKPEQENELRDKGVQFVDIDLKSLPQSLEGVMIRLRVDGVDSSLVNPSEPVLKYDMGRFRHILREDADLINPPRLQPSAPSQNLQVPKEPPQ